MPTSWIPRPSRAVNGRAVPGPPEFLLEFWDKSSFLGLGRELGILGEPGSFFTMILGWTPTARDGPEGEDLAPETPPALGLLLPGRCAAELAGPALAEAEAEVVVLCAEGETEAEAAVGGGSSEANEGLS